MALFCFNAPTANPSTVDYISLIFLRALLSELFNLLQIDLVCSCTVLPRMLYVGIDEILKFVKRLPWQTMLLIRRVMFLVFTEMI